MDADESESLSRFHEKLRNLIEDWRSGLYWDNIIDFVVTYINENERHFRNYGSSCGELLDITKVNTMYVSHHIAELQYRYIRKIVSLCFKKGFFETEGYEEQLLCASGSNEMYVTEFITSLKAKDCEIRASHIKG